MLCGGFWRAGSYKVGRQAAPPKVTSLKRDSLGTFDMRLYVCMHDWLVFGLAITNQLIWFALIYDDISIENNSRQDGSINTTLSPTV